MTSSPAVHGLLVRHARNATRSPAVTVVESIALVYDDGGERVLLDAGAVTA